MKKEGGNYIALYASMTFKFTRNTQFKTFFQFPSPQLTFEIVVKGREHKFWDLDAQIAQIFGTILNPVAQLRGYHFPGPPKLIRLWSRVGRSTNNIN